MEWNRNEIVTIAYMFNRHRTIVFILLDWFIRCWIHSFVVEVVYFLFHSSVRSPPPHTPTLWPTMGKKKKKSKEELEAERLIKEEEERLAREAAVRT